MDFPFGEINHTMHVIRGRFKFINYGGCGVLTYILARQLAKATTPHIMICSKNINCDGIIEEMANKGLPISHLFEIGIHHMWVEFEVNGDVYAVDIDGIVSADKMRMRWGNPINFNPTIRDAYSLSISTNGWNPTFDRDQIPEIKRFINKKLNKLFGPLINKV